MINTMQFVVKKKKIGNYLSRTRIKIAEKLNFLIFIEAYLHSINSHPPHITNNPILKDATTKLLTAIIKLPQRFFDRMEVSSHPVIAFTSKWPTPPRQSFDTFIHRWVHSFWLFNIAWNSSSAVILSFFIPFSNSLRVEPKSAKSDHLVLSIYAMWIEQRK